MDVPERSARTGKALLLPLRAAMADFPDGGVPAALDAVLAEDAVVHLSHPFGTMPGSDWHETAYAPLLRAFPDLERRDLVVVTGRTDDVLDWIGTCGHYAATFAAPFLDIPPTGHAAAMRFHEFFRIEDGRVAEVQAIWDVPELMMQAGAWPLAPSLGREWLVPGPATQDGLAPWTPERAREGRESAARVAAMLADMVRHPAEGGPEVMRLASHWHPRFSWYGPAGIGTSRGIRGFRAWHQIPFLAAMPDRGQHGEGLTHHLFGEGPYAALTGWPDMRQTLTGGGWLGLPPTGQRITLRSLDFWRLDAGLIRENWVLVDLLDVFAQLGVDALARMREVNRARHGFCPETGVALC